MAPTLSTLSAHLKAGPDTIRALQATTIVLASTASGLGLGLSFFAMPRILELPTHLLIRQFNATLNVSNKVMPPLLLLPGLLNGILAVILQQRVGAGSAASAAAVGGASWSWTAGSGVGSAVTVGSKIRAFFRPTWKLHAIAAVLTLTMVPWTFVAIKPLNRMMEARGKHQRDPTTSSSSSSSRDSNSFVNAVRSRGKKSREDDVEYIARKDMESAESVALRRGEMSSHAVVDRWALLNLYRPVVSLAIAGVGAYAALW